MGKWGISEISLGIRKCGYPGGLQERPDRQQDGLERAGGRA